MAFNTAHFSRMPASRKPHTRFNKPFTHAGTMMHGDIVPIYAKYVAPGDIINETIVGNIRMSTPIAPLYSSVKVSFNAFFIPMRLIWDNWVYFFGESKTMGPQTTTYYVPHRGLNCGSSGNYSHVTAGSVSHYLGKPLYKGSSIDSASDGSNVANNVSILKERAYWLTISEWYRSEQLEDAIAIFKDDSVNIYLGAGGVNGSFSDRCAKTNKDFDYFTTATVSPTYSATPVTMPIGQNALAPVIADGSFLHDMTDSGRWQVRLGINQNIGADSYAGLAIVNRLGSAIGDGVLTSEGYNSNPSGGYPNGRDVSASNLYAKLSNAAQASIEELYLAMAAEAWFHNANYGSRYFESLQVHYGVTNPDLVLNRPEHIGEKKIFLNMHQVLSTAGAANDASTKLGQPGANSSTDFKFNLFNKSFGEWGIVLILASTYHERYYTGGVDREDTYRELFDFYFPEFANIGDQAIRNSELYYSSGNGSTNDAAFGYQEAWAEMRYSNNRLSGFLDPYCEASVNSTQNALFGWTLGEKYSQLPLLNKTFVKENRDAIEDVLVSGSNGPDYLFYFYFDEKATRELPLYSVPGLPGKGRGII